jgi:hypothetical protein
MTEFLIRLLCFDRDGISETERTIVVRVPGEPKDSHSPHTGRTSAIVRCVSVAYGKEDCFEELPTSGIRDLRAVVNLRRDFRHESHVVQSDQP